MPVACQTQSPEAIPREANRPTSDQAEQPPGMEAALEQSRLAGPTFLVEPAPTAFLRTDGEAVGEAELPPSVDTWESDEQLRHIQRVLAGQQKGYLPASSAASRPTRIDASHHAPGRWNYPAVRQFFQDRLGRDRSPGWLSALISLVLSFGLMAFAFGGVLLGWSIFTGRQDLWTLGMPIALAGQIVLLMGFILQLDRLWSDNRHTAAKLEHVDERLHDLKATAELLGNPHTPPVAGFYHQWVGGLNSQMLLADLKSRLDLMAVKMGSKDSEQ